MWEIQDQHTVCLDCSSLKRTETWHICSVHSSASNHVVCLLFTQQQQKISVGCRVHFAPSTQAGNSILKIFRDLTVYAENPQKDTDYVMLGIKCKCSKNGCATKQIIEALRKRTECCKYIRTSMAFFLGKKAMASNTMYEFKNPKSCQQMALKNIILCVYALGTLTEHDVLEQR